MADASDDELWELDQSALDALAKAEAAVKQNPQLARASSSRAVVNNGDPVRLQQRDLFGNTIKPVVAANTSRAFSSLSNTSNALAGPSRLANGQTAAAAAGPVRDRVNAVVRKRWDRTIHAKSGAVSKSKGVAAGRYGSSSKTAGAARNTKGKGKARAYGNDYADDYDEEEDADVDEEDGPADQDSGDEGEAAPKQMKLSPDREACKTFVYPLNKPLRKYQYDIVTKAFYTDTLVALPTGLGKTFLAAVLMLNFYRWFPEGKIIFMAPTRPLVTQQIQACHGIAGIPLRDAVEMTGKDAPERREEEWRRRRIFYCTPQTVKNDLVKKRLNPSDIVCLVVDEAHRATGDYAYTEVIRYMMRHNPFFRVLALTATPGGNAEVVQAVVDNLHIGHIEVRTDESLDIRQYIHKKKVDQILIPVEGEIGSIRDRYITLMNILLDPLRKAGIVRTNKSDPTTMHPYTFQMAGVEASKNGKNYARVDLAFLGHMSRAVAKLLAQSVTAFNESLKELNSQAKGKCRQVINHVNYASILRDTEDIVNGREFEGHPKMVKLRELIIEHFEKSKIEGTLDETRIMVFCSFREVVDEIVERLNRCEGIRATRLVGQGQDTKGKKGLGQKQQNEVLAQFKKGVHNVLVATSIGEEGLDIGELDLIVCYEASKSPIRTLQRAGRTGRARDGRIIVLMTEGIEEQNWSKANEDYKGVQNAIVSGKQFELYADGHRLVPDDIRPVPEKRMVEVEPFDPEKMGVGHRRVIRRKRDEEESDNLDLFESGFQKANGKKIAASRSKSKSRKPVSSGSSEPPESSDVEILPDDDGRLTAAEKAEVSRKAVVPSVQAAQRARVRPSALPTGISSLQNHSASATRGFASIPFRSASSNFKSIGISHRTASLASVFQRGREMSADSTIYKAWEDATYPAFKNSNVVWWPEDRQGKGRDATFSPLRLVEEDRSGSKNKSGRAALAKASNDAIDIDEDDDSAIEDILPSLPRPDDARLLKGKRSKADRVDDSDDGSDDDEELPDLPSRSTGAASGAGKARKRRANIVESESDDNQEEEDVPRRPSADDRAGAAPAPHKPQQATAATAPSRASSVIELDDSDEEPADIFMKVGTDRAGGGLIDGHGMPATMQAAESTDLRDLGIYAEAVFVQPRPKVAPKSQLADRNVGAADEIQIKHSPGQPAIVPETPGQAGPTSLASPQVLDEALDMSMAMSVEESPIVFRRRVAGKAIVPDDETSSPEKQFPRQSSPRLARTIVPSNVDESVILLTQAPRRPGRLKRAREMDENLPPSETDGAGRVNSDAFEGNGKDPKHGKRKRQKQKKLPGDQCPFFDMRAINSDDPDSETDSEEEGEPETTTDRRFLDSEDVSNPNDMSAFYRESLMSQAAHRFHGGVVRPGAFKMRVDAAKRYVAPRTDEEQLEASQWSYGSFVVDDDEDILYESQEDNLPDEEIPTSESR